MYLRARPCALLSGIAAALGSEGVGEECELLLIGGAGDDGGLSMPAWLLKFTWSHRQGCWLAA